NRNRAVITGLGVVAPNGIGVENFWRTLVAGQSGIGRITRFDPSGMKSQIAGEVKDFDPHKYVGSELKPKRRARHTQFALAATAMAMEDAGIDLERNPLRQSLPVMMGVGSSSFEIIADSGVAVAARGARHASPILIAESSPHSVA